MWSSDAAGIADLVYSLDRKDVIGVYSMPAMPTVEAFVQDSDAMKAIVTMMHALPGENVRIVSSTDDGSKAVVLASSDMDPGTFYLWDAAAGKAAALLQRAPWIKPAAMASKQAVEFKARDGLLLHGYLSTPPGKEQARHLPLVLYVHGGPFGIRDEWEYDPYVQALATHGYAVLQVNYRGSSGYGSGFIRAGYGEWGGKMQDDLTDAVKWAIAQGITTADQVAIYGASYGGYATLAGLTFTPELYRCGINYVGVADLGPQVAPYKISSSPRAQIFASEQMGDDRTYLHDRSPVNFVQNIRVPLLNAYGYNDARVDIRQWKLLEPELKKYGKTYEIIIAGEEGHGFQNEAARLDFYHRMDAFLAKYFPVK